MWQYFYTASMGSLMLKIRLKTATDNNHTYVFFPVKCFFCSFEIFLPGKGLQKKHGWFLEYQNG